MRIIYSSYSILDRKSFQRVFILKFIYKYSSQFDRKAIFKYYLNKIKMLVNYDQIVGMCDLDCMRCRQEFDSD